MIEAWIEAPSLTVQSYMLQEVQSELQTRQRTYASLEGHVISGLADDDGRDAKLAELQRLYQAERRLRLMAERTLEKSEAALCQLRAHVARIQPPAVVRRPTGKIWAGCFAVSYHFTWGTWEGCLYIYSHTRYARPPTREWSKFSVGSSLFATLHRAHRPQTHRQFAE